MNVKLVDRQQNVVEFMVGVKAIFYDRDFDRYHIIYLNGQAEKVWANGGSLKVET